MSAEIRVKSSVMNFSLSKKSDDISLTHFISTASHEIVPQNQTVTANCVGDKCCYFACQNVWTLKKLYHPSDILSAVCELYRDGPVSRDNSVTTKHTNNDRLTNFTGQRVSKLR